MAESEPTQIRPRGAKPSGRPAAATLIVGAGFGLGAVVRLAGMRSAGRSVTVLLFTLAGGLACWGLWLLYRTNANLMVRGGELRRTDALGRVSTVALAQISQVIRQSVRINWLAAPSPQLFFVAADGHCLLRVYASQYSESDIARLCAAGGLQLTGSSGDVLTARDARRRYPGSYSWWLAHPWALAWAIAVVGVAVGVAIAGR